MFVCFFFFKQKTAYEMRISDWSSDVCSSDLLLDLVVGGIDGRQLPVGDLDELLRHALRHQAVGMVLYHQLAVGGTDFRVAGVAADAEDEIGRASCRERVCQYV